MISLVTGRRKQSPIGIDIGEGGVRAAQTTYTAGQYEITTAARSDHPWPDTENHCRTAGLQHRIQTCLRQGTFRGRMVATALTSPDIEFHTLDLPQTILSENADRVDEIVHWEVERLLSKPQENIETRHWNLPPTKMPAPNAIGTATPREAVERAIQVCDDINLNCTYVDTAATALCRLGTTLNAWNSEQLWGILDLGYRETRLVLCLDDVPVLARTIGSGGYEWTKRVAESLQIGVKAAEIHKCYHGIAMTPRGVRSQPADTKDDKSPPPASELGAIILGILRSDLRNLAAEVKRSFEYVLSCYPARNAADLVLVGGGAEMRNLPEYLSESLGIPVHLASSYLGSDNCRIRWGSSRHDSLEPLAVAIGLAVQE